MTCGHLTLSRTRVCALMHPRGAATVVGRLAHRLAPGGRLAPIYRDSCRPGFSPPWWPTPSVEIGDQLELRQLPSMLGSAPARRSFHRRRQLVWL
jgi:hypothetical protein